MKRLSSLIMGLLLAVPIMAPVYAIAETTTTTTENSKPTTSDSSKPVSSETTAKTAEELAKELAARILQRKTDLKTKLTAAQKVRIQDKCKASQGLISSVKGRVNGIETSRTEVNKNIVNRLTELSAKIKAKGVDTTALDADIATLKTKVDTFKADLVLYKQTVADLVDVDCKTDPDGFKASLDAARTALTKVGDDSKAIRTYVDDTIKPLLKTIRAQLETKETTGGQ